MAGFAGALLITLFESIARLLKLSMFNGEILLGSLFLRPEDVETVAKSWFLGWALHLLLGSGLGLLYTAVFRALQASGAALGAGIAVFHWILAGFVLGALGAFHPRIPGELPDPGYYAVNFGPVSFLGLLALHLFFGAFVGWSVGATRSRAEVFSFDETEDHSPLIDRDYGDYELPPSALSRKRPSQR